MRKYFKKVFYLLLTLQILFAGFPLSTFAYPTYQANSDLVITGPYDTPVSSGTTWGANAANPIREFITIGQKYRIRQNGTINRVYLYTNTKTNLTGFYIKIWRKSGANYNLVGTSNNIVSNLQAGSYNTVDLSTPISGVQEGDYIGYRAEGDQNNFYARSGVTGVTTYYVGNTTPSETDYAWESQTVATGFVMPINVYMQAPQVVFIGDSIVAGHPGHYSFLETTATTNIESTMEKQFYNLTGYSYQNMGVGSQVTTNIAARFTADVINLHPQIVVIEGGINDISFGGANKDTFLANWTTMLNAAQADASIQTIVVLKILPWTNGSTVQMQAHDDWNASLATLASGYLKAIVVDANSYVGQFRAGGDAGNLWNNQAQYSPDGTHFNQAGHLQIAQAIVDNLPKPSATFDNDFSTWNTGNITTNYNLIQTGGSANTNISQTGSSGIEYSTDGSIWSDATKGTGGDALTGLTSTASPGTGHSFIWDSATDLSTTEDSTVYLRIRPNDGTTSAADWVTSNAFGIDNVAPSSVGVPTFGTITTSSIQITKPATVTENGAGLYQWQTRRNETTELGYIATSTNTVTDSDLSPNTQYTYDVKFKDNSNNISNYGTQASKYTLIQTPAGISFDNVGVNSLTISASGTLSNISTASSGLFFSETSGNTGGANSTWLQTNSYQNTGLSENTQYTFKVMARNGNGTETEYTTTSSKYTLADTPTNLSASSNSNSVTLTVDSLPNATSGSSGYYFSRSGANSGWIQTNSWTDTGLSCGHSYDYSVIYRNGDGTETSSISTTKSTSGCGGGGMPAGWNNLPIMPTGGFKVFINSGSSTTSNRIVNLNFNAGSDVKKMAISLTGDFNDAGQENYSSTKQIDLCSKFGVIKNSTCPDGTYKVYVKFYTYYGQSSGIASSTIVLKSGSTDSNIGIGQTPTTQASPNIGQFTLVLKYGSNNTQVLWLQNLLNNLGFFPANVKPNGNFGPITKQAVQKFQCANKLVCSGNEKTTGYGQVGPKTRQVLNSQNH